MLKSAGKELVMKSVIIFAALSVMLSACSQTDGELKPIPGSITYHGQPSQKLTQSPIGARIRHHFTDDLGQDVYETYVLQPDRSLRLVDRQTMTRPL
jgi:hypothetical protein